MAKLRTFLTLALASLLTLSACGSAAKLPITAGMGPQPALPEPSRSLIPVVKVLKAVGWPSGSTPVPADGLTVQAFARDFDHPRWVYVLPNGDVLVAEADRPDRPQDFKGLRAWFMKRDVKKAGAGAPSANRIALLRDTNNDGVADLRTVFLANLYSPLGMALVGDTMYIANNDAVVKVPYVRDQTTSTATPVKVTDLPAGTRYFHWTRNIIASLDGSKLYATVGSSSNVAEHGLADEEGRAAIWEIDLRTGQKRLYATGLRNPNGMAWAPGTDTLWTVVNERDERGSDMVPDFLTSVRDGGFYGWPFSYFGQHVDTRVKPQNPAAVAAALVPDYALGPHTGSLGLTAASGTAMPSAFRNGMFVGQHGSWNRKPISGYKVIFVPFVNGQPAGQAVDVLTGFVNHDEKAMGRPVGVAMDLSGALLVADDVGNVVWRVTASKRQN